jgi:hypothetical protein
MCTLTRYMRGTEHRSLLVGHVHATRAQHTRTHSGGRRSHSCRRRRRRGRACTGSRGSSRGWTRTPRPASRTPAACARPARPGGLRSRRTLRTRRPARSRQHHSSRTRRSCPPAPRWRAPAPVFVCRAWRSNGWLPRSPAGSRARAARSSLPAARQQHTSCEPPAAGPQQRRATRPQPIGVTGV